MALARPGLGPYDFREEGFGGGVAMQDAILSALLVIDDELEGEVGLARPARLRWGAPIAQQIARVGVLAHRHRLLLGATLFGAVHAVAGIAETRHDIAVLVEAHINCRGIYGHVRVGLRERGQTLGGSQEAEEAHAARAMPRQPIDGG